MSHTERYRAQHAEITRLAGDLKLHLESQGLANDAGAAHSILSELNGKLFVHLAAEDNVLYPQLLESADAKMKAIAQCYIEEMRPISRAFKNFAVRWGSVRAIQSNTDMFINESHEILAALEHRIRREHEELYSMADKLQLTATRQALCRSGRRPS